MEHDRIRLTASQRRLYFDLKLSRIQRAVKRRIHKSFFDDVLASRHRKPKMSESQVDPSSEEAGATKSDASEPSRSQDESSGANSATAPVVVQVPNSGRRWIVGSLVVLLLISFVVNYCLFTATVELTRTESDKFVSGNEDAEDQIAVIDINGTIIPPFTERVLGMIKRAKESTDVKGVLLSIDSPGGLVADSHQLYHRLQELAKEKPVWVSMKRIAASGGVYAAMGVGPKGRIFAEPTTWTGSIGVIIPRYDLSELAKQYGVKTDSLATGKFKDSLNPFRPLSDADRELWGEILDDSYDRFVGVVSKGRGLKEEKVRNELATGQIFTANQALKNGLIDDIQFEDDVLLEFQKHLKLDEVKVLRYRHPATMIDLLLSEAKQRDAQSQLAERFLESTVPRAMYYFSWLPELPE
jgi:protease IV